MYCSKCGKEIAEGSFYCEKCGNKISSSGTNDKITIQLPQKVVLNPEEVVEHKEVKDSSKTFSGTGKVFGIALIVIGILCDLITIVLIGTGSDFTIPLISGGAIVFFIGFLVVIFARQIKQNFTNNIRFYNSIYIDRVKKPPKNIKSNEFLFIPIIYPPSIIKSLFP